MNVEREDLGNNQVQLTITVEPERVQEQMRQSARKMSKGARVPGFRPGKAPYHILLQYFGERAILEEAVEELLPKVLEEAVTETGTEIWRADEIEPSIESLDPLTLRVVIPMPPRVELGDPATIEYTRESVAVQEERVLDALEDLREGRATWIPTAGPAEYGDLITLDLQGDLVDGTRVVDVQGFEGILSEQERPEDEQAPASEILIPGQERPAGDQYPDLSAQLVGMIANQVKSFNLTYPRDWADEKVAGRTVLYRATLLEIKKKALPALDDELARSVGEFDDLDALKDRVRTNLLAEAEYEERNRLGMAILDGLVEASVVEYPPAMLKRQIDGLIGDLEERLKTYERTLDDYLSETGQTREELEDEYRERAEFLLRRSLVLSEFVRQRELEVTPDEMRRELLLTVSPYGDRAPALLERIMGDEEASVEVINRVMTRKAMNRLVAEVTGEPEEPLFPEMEGIDEALELEDFDEDLDDEDLEDEDFDEDLDDEDLEDEDFAESDG
ncbi:MAG TPA: trigger factor, partial [Ardenticatenaceae bacterium]|nr:trigger factor [Ardenticatenaceae bacterium]